MGVLEIGDTGSWDGTYIREEVWVYEDEAEDQSCRHSCADDRRSNKRTPLPLCRRRWKGEVSTGMEHGAWAVGWGGLRLRGRLDAMRGAAGPAQDGGRKGRYGLGLVLVLAGAMDQWNHALPNRLSARSQADGQTHPNRPGGLASRAGSVGRHGTAAEQQRSR